MNLNSQSSGASFLNEINRDQQEISARQRAQKLKLGYVNFKTQTVNVDALKLLSPEEAQKLGAILFNKLGKKLKIAVCDEKNITELQTKFAEFKLEFYLCSRLSFEEAWRTYQTDFFRKKKVVIKKNVDEEEKVLSSRLADFEQLETKINELPSESAISEILLLSVAAKASDIHFQPAENKVSLRLRLDGVLHKMLEIKPEPAKKIVMGIKYMAGMHSNITDVPQDGGIIKKINKRSVDFRVSTLPTAQGIESVVIRILDSAMGLKSFSQLGFSRHVETKILKSLYRKNGIILVTGPTGSGKTTTLYSMLAELNSPERKLVTLEDPIEYRLEGVSQAQVNEAKQFNFETGFKSLLRHDPDVILVGEIRTLKTAKLAFEAALTGHTVLSSLHSNSSVGAISRLRNMGVDSFNIAPTISAVFAQKLVRKLCPHCKKEKIYDLDQNDLKDSIQRLKKVLPDTKIPLEKIDTKNIATLPRLQKVSAKFYVAEGCAECSQTGYKGQTAICEAFLVNDKVREKILNKASEAEIIELLQSENEFLSIFEDGLLKVFAGETSLPELIRVVGR